MIALMYPAILTTSLLLFTYLYSPNIKQSHEEANNIRYILLWTKPFKDPLSFLRHGFDAFISNGCEYTNCYVMHNASELGDVLHFDVVVFNGRQLPVHEKQMKHYHWPQGRSPHQRYVYATMEPAQSYPICDTHFNGFFNWTWTYRLDSESRWGYVTVFNMTGQIVGPKKDMHWQLMDPIDDHTKPDLSSKSIAAVWFVSRCKTKSRREEFVNHLEKVLPQYGLKLDVYGACGRGRGVCRRGSRECDKLLEKKYYFYLALENSINEDYVTEKVLTALDHYAVPVVFGGANYSRFLPPDSYLNARELGAGRLAARMAAIIDNHRNGGSLYHDFFRWRKYYTFKSTAAQEDVCNVCTLLNDPAAMSQTTVYKHFREWWLGKNVRCYRPRWLKH